MSKKILMVLDEEFPPDDRVYKESQTLIQNGFSVTIACYTRINKSGEEWLDGIHIIRKKIPKLIYKSSIAALKFPMYFMWWKKYLSVILHKQPFDIIHIHDLPLAKVGFYIKKRYHFPLVLDLHENWPSHLSKALHTNTFIGKLLSSNKKWRNYEFEAVTKADIVITVVEEMKNRLTKLGLQTDKLVVLQNTLTPKEYVNQKAEKDSRFFTLIFAGGLNIERGLQYVIPALDLLKSRIPEIRLQIVGKGSYQDTLEAMVSNLKLNSFVEFIGWKPVKELIILTAKADIALIPHIKWEQTDCSSPNKLFQYMHAGIPLLVSNCDSVARIVNETKSGEVYRYNSIEDFALKVQYLYQNRENREELGRNGQFWVKEKYNWNQTSKEFVAMYQNLLQK
jgi:glycosyltransferase involved in cell wall biosynthesis